MTNKFNIIYLLSLFIAATFALTSCGTTHQINKGFKQQHKENSFFKGFVLYNPITKNEIISHNGHKFFTPASNTKLFTFYTAYKTLEDSISGLAYYKSKDSLILKGTADPSLLYSTTNSKIINFLKNEKDSIYLVNATIDETNYGSGWAWDDYQYYYMPEKNLLPIYGNIVKYNVSDSLITSTPSYFNEKINVLDSITLRREFRENKFYFRKGFKKENEVPFITSNLLVTELLSEITNKNIQLIPDNKSYKYNIIKSVKSDSLYKQMLVKSDNFIAEQLLLQVGKKVANSFSVKNAIDYSLKNYLHDLPQKPRWVDASGLSRYNLFSPNNFIFLLDKMYNEIPLNKLLSYFPEVEKTGTLKRWNKDEKQYIFAKTGSLSNNYNLSGYLITKKGTILIFSYMNNHYQKSTSAIKKDIQKTLSKIYKTY